jgi:hypothetical protein
VHDRFDRDRELLAAVVALPGTGPVLLALELGDLLRAAVSAPGTAGPPDGLKHVAGLIFVHLGDCEQVEVLVNIYNVSPGACFVKCIIPKRNTPRLLSII